MSKLFLNIVFPVYETRQRQKCVTSTVLGGKIGESGIFATFGAIGWYESNRVPE